MKCEYCGKEFKRRTRGNDSNKYCSRECAFADKKVKPKEKVLPVCVVCDIEFEGRPDSKYCSDECRKAKGRKMYQDRYKISVRDTNPIIEKQCKWCGVVFKSNYYVSMREFCSHKCAKRYSKLQCKSRARGLYISPVSFIDIYKRDNGTCQICGKIVDMEVDKANAMGATIDHIIPLSKGGTHEPCNVQLAHRRCNSLKGDKIPEILEAMGG